MEGQKFSDFKQKRGLNVSIPLKKRSLDKKSSTPSRLSPLRFTPLKKPPKRKLPNSNQKKSSLQEKQDDIKPKIKLLRQMSKQINGLVTIGKVAKFIRNAKSTLKYSKFENLSKEQLQLIGDSTYFERNMNDESHMNPKFRRSKTFLKKVVSQRNLSTSQSDILSYEKIIRASLLIFIKKYVHVIKPASTFRILWDSVISMATIFTMFSITISIFFSYSWMTQSMPLESIDLIFKIVYVLDILLKFNMGYFQSGIIIKDRKKIALHYLKRKMFWDLIGVLVLLCPIINSPKEDFLEANKSSLQLSWVNVYKLLFFVKIYQLIDIYHVWEEILQNDENIEGIFSLIKLFLQVIFIAHIMACIWNHIGVNQRESGGVNWFSKYPDVPFKNDWTLQYTFSLYWSLATMVTVGYGDVSATNNTEAIFSIISMIFGCGFFAYAINSIGLILENFKENNKILKKELRIINRFMKTHKISYGLRIKVRKYLEHLWSDDELKDKEKTSHILNKLSSSLREEVLIHSNGRMLLNLPVFLENFTDPCLEKIAQVLKPQRFAPGEIIFHRNDSSNPTLFIIEKGEVELYAVLGNKTTVSSIKTLKEGDSFGKLEFFTGSENKYNAKSVGFSTIFTLSRTDALKIFEDFNLDFETFHMIKDQISLYHNLKKSTLNCESCGEENHTISSCPFLYYVPVKETVLRKMMMITTQESRKKDFIRKRRRARNALITIKVRKGVRSNNQKKKTLLSYNLNRNEDSISLIMDEGEPNQVNHKTQKSESSQSLPESSSDEDDGHKKKELKRILSVVNFNKDAKRNSFIEKDLNQGENEKDIEEFEGHSASTPGTANSLRKNSLSPMRRTNHEPNSPEGKINGVSDNVKKQISLFNLMNFDKMKIFFNYFPYNNYNSVLEYLANRKLRSKNYNQPNILNDSVLEKSKSSDGVSPSKFGASSNGLLNYYDQQKFYKREKLTRASVFHPKNTFLSLEGRGAIFSKIKSKEEF